ncbi:hypothetical protein GGI02_002259 [Coemansia sp. RSA 2322]|uniref:Uncharacterized protein n=1 Tax=Coemansia thaxteri TaxID=2663907 RepID=A0A9W8BLJ8_9FUNG|nr:hypothetical protein H4R26_001615 [Coemansia thaxteri]KAJ2471463.1 hypothetical protein GGI02_002259 [Coemansia sp. RSA 2322]
MFFRGCTMAGYGTVSDMPPPDWCITTLKSLTTKYEHLADSRKVKPPFAEAVLNSFKSKLLNLVSTHSLYDSDDISDCEPEWPLGNDCSSPFIDLKSSDCVYDSDVLTATENYLTISLVDIVDCATPSCTPEDCDITTGLLSPSPSPTSPVSASSYLDADSLDAAVAQCAASGGNSSSSDIIVTLPPNIEEALRRFLADSSDQLLSETFTTFADPEGMSSAAPAQTASSNADLDDDQGQFIDESGGSSPESIVSSDDAIEFLAATDPVDLFVKNFVAGGPAWDSAATALQCQPALPLDAAALGNADVADAQDSVDEDEEDDSELPPCKRKRRGEAESKDAKAILRNSLPISPRKRSRSVSSRRGDAAAVPFSTSGGAESPPPLLSLCISTAADATPSEA